MAYWDGSEQTTNSVSFTFEILKILTLVESYRYLACSVYYTCLQRYWKYKPNL